MEKLLTKKDKLKFLINKNKSVLICPLCKSGLNLQDYSLVCNNKHTFDLSKNGTLLLMKQYEAKHDKTYTKELFENRRKFVKNNFYSSVYEVIKKFIKEDKSLNVLDLGCGECTHLYNILKNQNHNIFGADLSYDAIKLATDYLQNDILPICCDASNLPFGNNIFDVIINFLSPFYTNEVVRTLKENGIFIKVVPTENYLIELRKNFNIKDYEKEDEVKRNLLKNFDIINEFFVSDVYALSSGVKENLCKMTPMLNYINTENKEGLKSINISLKIYIMKIKK